MKNHSKQVDDYIANSADFAQPILKSLRAWIHEVCPDIIETIKWKFPNFEYNGKIVCNMASFKKHCSFGFWSGHQLSDPHNLLKPVGATPMAYLEKIKSLEDLPKEEILKSYIKEAIQLIEMGMVQATNTKKSSSSAKEELVYPETLSAALLQSTDASTFFESLSYSNKKEYIDWINEAKTDTTRLKRLETTLEWLSEGKVRNWKYLKK